METEHEFMLILAGVSDLTDEAVDALYEAGCDDSTIMTQSGQVIMGFTRSAPSREDAIVSAISDIERANVGAWVKKVEPVVTESDTSHDDLAIAINTVLAARATLGAFPKLAGLLETANVR